MDEDVKAFVRMISMVSLQHSSKAGRIADDLEEFLKEYPDTELRRKGRWMVRRLRSIYNNSV